MRHIEHRILRQQVLCDPVVEVEPEQAAPEQEGDGFVQVRLPLRVTLPHVADQAPQDHAAHPPLIAA